MKPTIFFAMQNSLSASVGSGSPYFDSSAALLNRDP
jgi:hypothetical protein